VKLASIYIDLPDELEEDNNVNIANLHRTVTNMAKQLNYVMGNIDTDNMTEEIADAISSITEGE
jgi:serine/threonine-protein kinase RIO1